MTEETLLLLCGELCEPDDPKSGCHLPSNHVSHRSDVRGSRVRWFREEADEIQRLRSALQEIVEMIDLDNGDHIYNIEAAVITAKEALNA